MNKPLPPAPHIREEGNTAGLMRAVGLALLPALVWSVYAFGWRILFIAVIAMGSAVAGEALIGRFLTHRPLLRDGSAAVSGLIFAMLTPPAVSLPLVCLGAFLAAGVKQAFGGLGKNPVNPAVFSAALLYPFFRRALTAYTRPFAPLPVFRIFFSAEELAPFSASSDPLTLWRAGRMPEQNWYQLLSGDLPGALGTGSALLLLSGGLYLLANRVISWREPVAFLAGVFLMSISQAPAGENPLAAAGISLLSGGAMFGAFFVVTDPVTSPVTRWGQLCYGLAAGLLTAVFRRLTGDVFGMVYAVLLVNLLARPLDFLFRPRPYGGRYFQQFTALQRPRPSSAPLPDEKEKSAPKE